MSRVISFRLPKIKIKLVIWESMVILIAAEWVCETCSAHAWLYWRFNFNLKLLYFWCSCFCKKHMSWHVMSQASQKELVSWLEKPGSFSHLKNLEFALSSQLQDHVQSGCLHLLAHICYLEYSGYNIFFEICPCMKFYLK